LENHNNGETIFMDDREKRREALRRYGIARMDFGLEQSEILLRFGRAFADPMRIRMLVLLAGRSMYGQELAEALGVTTPTISHHIALLKGAGLIKVRRENSYRHYELDPVGLQTIAENLTIEHLQSLDPTCSKDSALGQQPPEEMDRAMVEESFFKDGRLVAIPPDEQPRRYAMEIVARAFEWGRIYEKKDVNAILKEIHSEVAMLRRELIDQKIMQRENGRYWLVHPLS
jgi:ArsR family transcriptional regulator, arsenate/arsenite/antimonite-responsive transcriptional repressor